MDPRDAFTPTKWCYNTPPILASRSRVPTQDRYITSSLPDTLRTTYMSASLPLQSHTYIKAVEPTSSHFPTQGLTAAHPNNPTVAKMNMNTTASSFLESLSATPSQPYTPANPAPQPGSFSISPLFHLLQNPPLPPPKPAPPQLSQQEPYVPRVEGEGQTHENKRQTHPPCPRPCKSGGCNPDRTACCNHCNSPLYTPSYPRRPRSLPCPSHSRFHLPLLTHRLDLGLAHRAHRQRYRLGLLVRRAEGRGVGSGVLGDWWARRGGLWCCL